MTTAMPPRRPFPVALPPTILLIVAAALLALAFRACDGTTPWLAATNVSHELVVEVHVGGDRLLILAPLATEYLRVTPAAWAWPRRIEVYRYPSGPRLLAWRADLTDLADYHWHLRVP